ncbi:MAG: hypothetical protein PUC65_03525, partial [Clostridiales bacterium]|nr:hypothetical protein [Clostridiales bacterium]
YIELKGIVILANDDIMLENNSTQSVIRVSELVTVLRSYPIQFNDEQMKQINAILSSQQIPTPNIVIPNYRKQIIETLDRLLEEKIQLIQSNHDLINEINVVSNNITKKNKYNFVPLFIRKSEPVSATASPREGKPIN